MQTTPGIHDAPQVIANQNGCDVRVEQGKSIAYYTPNRTRDAQPTNTTEQHQEVAHEPLQALSSNDVNARGERLNVFGDIISEEVLNG